jgi:hypothetical protein
MTTGAERGMADPAQADSKDSAASAEAQRPIGKCSFMTNICLIVYELRPNDVIPRGRLCDERFSSSDEMRLQAQKPDLT